MAIQDIYGYKRNQKPDAVLSSEESILTFGGGDSIGAMIQNWQLNYQQNVQEIFELGSQNLYWLKGRPVGQGQIGRIVGYHGALLGMIPHGAFDLCAGGELIRITGATGMCGGDSGRGAVRTSIEVNGVAVTDVGYSQSVDNAQLMENVTFRFATMDVA